MEAHLQAWIDYFALHPALAVGAVFAASLLEALAVVGTVIPGSSVVFAGGVLAGLRAADPWWIASAAIAGAVFGDGISYWLGHRYRDRIPNVWPLKNRPGLLARGHDYFRRNGGKSVFLGRFLGPVRAIVPVIAGMAGMRPAAFYAVNLASAIAWAAVHILPGMLFGASLQLAGAVSGRLVLLLVALAVACWLLARVVRLAHRTAWPRVRALRDRLVGWARGRRGPGPRILLSLLDPSRPESPALLTAAVALAGGGWLFLGVLEDVASHDPLVQFDRTVYALLQNLRTDWTDGLMAGISEIGGTAGTATLIAAVAVLLAVQRCRRTLAYWLAAAGFGEGVVWLLKDAVGRARPTPLYAGAELFSFPSGHVASAVVVYGFLGFLLARGRPPRAKVAIGFGAGAAILAIAFSRLYLGAHWFSDVAASLGLGLAWIALLAIAYTHHAHGETLRAGPLLAAIPLALAAVGIRYGGERHRLDLERYAFRPASATMLSGWRSDGWRRLPAARSELDGDAEEPFTLQWAGSADCIGAALRDAGWRTPPAWSATTAASWLLPQPSIGQLPVLPKFDHGRPAQATFEKVLDPARRAVVRLWKSPFATDDADDASGAGSAIRIGSVTFERLHRPAGLFSFARTGRDFSAPVRMLAEDLRGGQAAVEQRQRQGLPLLLVQCAPESGGRREK